MFKLGTLNLLHHFINGLESILDKEMMVSLSIDLVTYYIFIILKINLVLIYFIIGT